MEGGGSTGPGTDDAGYGEGVWFRRMCRGASRTLLQRTSTVPEPSLMYAGSRDGSKYSQVCWKTDQASCWFGQTERGGRGS